MLSDPCLYVNGAAAGDPVEGREAPVLKNFYENWPPGTHSARIGAVCERCRGMVRPHGSPKDDPERRRI